jgi:hypothetical protein
MSYKINSLEFQLALSCSALDVEKALDLSSQLKFRADFNETQFLIFLRRHYISELAFHTLNGNSLFSDSFYLKLEDQVKFNQLKSLKGQSIQVKLQAYFDEYSIYAIFLKGILLSRQYYGDIGLRNLVDIDVWVDENDFINVKSFLLSIGYIGILDKYDFNSKQLNFLKQSTHHEIFFNELDHNAPVVELHWKIRNALGNFNFNTKKDRRLLSSVEISGESFSVFNHVDQFIFLSVHGAEHAWFKIKWLVDLFYIVKTVDLDWSKLFARAKELHSVIEVKLAWELLAQLYGLEKPDSFKQIKLSLMDQFRLKYFSHQLVYNGRFCDTPKEKLFNALFTLSLSRKIFLSKELVYKNLTNITDWLTLRLPENLFFLYFPLRPFFWVYRKFKVR